VHRAFAELLARVELLRDGALTPRDLRGWPHEWLESLEAMGILVQHREADEIVYDGCDHECTIPNLGFEKHPDEPDRLVRIHRCMHGCGLVIFEPPDFAQWRFSLTGLAGAVAKAIGASGVVVEDVFGRVALAGTVGDSMRTVDVFVASGLTRDDAATVLSACERLQVAQEPFVLTLATMPQATIWPGGMRPAVAVLAEHARLGPAGLALDIEPLLGLESIPHHRANSPRWLRNKEAAERLQEVVSGITVKQAAARVSLAGSRDAAFRTNGQTGAELRIETASFMDWLWKQRAADLAKADKIVEDKPAKRLGVRAEGAARLPDPR